MINRKATVSYKQAKIRIRNCSILAFLGRRMTNVIDDHQINPIPEKS